jgi:predicted RNA-binding Zn-ribbon protein involved in translation (DUF1610 family)
MDTAVPVHGCTNGHYLCHNCTYRVGESPCPTCGAEIDVRRDINRLMDHLGKTYSCPHFAEGCKQELAATAMAMHLEKCEYRYERQITKETLTAWLFICRPMVCDLSAVCTTNKRKYSREELLLHWSVDHKVEGLFSQDNTAMTLDASLSVVFPLQPDELFHCKLETLRNI